MHKNTAQAQLQSAFIFLVALVADISLAQSCPSNSGTHLFTLLPLGVIKNNCDHWDFTVGLHLSDAACHTLCM